MVKLLSLGIAMIAKSGIKEENKENLELEFTGNWFIDGGILGFVNLMEEVYGWDLEELQKRIREDPKVVYYGYFPFAYFYNLSEYKEKLKIKEEVIRFIEEHKSLEKDELLDKIWWKYITELFRKDWINKKIEHTSKHLKKRGKLKHAFLDKDFCNMVEKREKLLNELVKKYEKELTKIFGGRKKLKNEKGEHNLKLNDIDILKNINQQNLSSDILEIIKEIIEIHENIEKYLNKIWNEVQQKKIREEMSVFCRIPVDSGFYKNFLFFNNSRGILEQLEDLRNILEGNITYSKYLSRIDKTLNKFLPSENEFPNISYTEFRLEPLIKTQRFTLVYILNFINSFNSIPNMGHYFFYTPDLEFTYKVNKKLRIYFEKTRSNEQKYSLIDITWKSILDSIFEKESLWILENMFLIRYRNILQQDLIDVEYIGIPKLQATFILDDSIRDNLNFYLPVKRADKGFQRVWLLEEFLKNKPLLTNIISYLHLRLSDSENQIPKFSKVRLLYPALVDAKIKEFGERKGEEKRIFDELFFDRYRRVVEDVKEDFKGVITISKSLSNLFESDEAEKYARILFDLVRKSQKFKFVNSMLKILNQKRDKDLETIRRVINFLFEKVLNNKFSWQNYAIVFVVALLSEIEGGDRGGDEENRRNLEFEIE